MELNLFGDNEKEIIVICKSGVHKIKGKFSRLNAIWDKIFKYDFVLEMYLQ